MQIREIRCRCFDDLKKLLALCLFFSLLATATDAAAISFATARSAFGFQITQWHFNTIVTGIELLNSGPDSITLGSFDDAGNVTGGDAALVVFLDLGSAPLNQVLIAGVNDSAGIGVTPASPRASGVANTQGAVLPPDFPGFGLNFPAGFEAAASGEGDLFLGLAFLEHANQPLSQALGVTVPYRIRIGDLSGFLAPDGQLLINTAFSIGGASLFAIPEPSSLWLLASGAFMLNIRRFLWQRR